MSEQKSIQEEYLENGGTRCPVCGSDHLSGEQFEAEPGSASQLIICNDCGSSWSDVYTLSGITNIEVAE